MLGGGWFKVGELQPCCILWALFSTKPHDNDFLQAYDFSKDLGNNTELKLCSNAKHDKLSNNP